MSSDPFTVVRYRWPDDSEWQQVKVPGYGADVELSPEVIPQDCPGGLFYVDFSVTSQLVSGDCVTGSIIKTITLYWPWGEPETTSGIGRWFVRFPQYNLDGSFKSYQPAGYYCRTSEQKPNPKIIGHRLHPASPSCDASGCRLKVMDESGKLIYQEVRQGDCPEWEIEKPCPPNTLPCGDCCFECGGYINDFRGLTDQVRRLIGSPLMRE